MERYSRQALLAEIGEEGQRRLLASGAAIIGCGALGSVLASTLVRAGVGRVKIVDRDYIELNNLQRQILFDEEDIARGLPKAVAAAEKLRRVNSESDIEALVTDVSPANVEEIISDVDLVLDGTDNFETRFLLNDACLKHAVPWVYAAVVSTYGMTMAIVPQRTPCFRCFLPDLPPPGSTATCDTAGVLGPAVHIVASLAATEALKLLLDKQDEMHRRLLYVDAWTGTLERLEVGKSIEPCPACDLGRFDFLQARHGSYMTRLCGRDVVRVSMRGETRLSLPDLAERLARVGDVTVNQYMLQFSVGSKQITLFPDGRAIIKGTSDEAAARTLYARYIGF